MIDKINYNDMLQGEFTNFTSDRFGCENSALAMNNGWTQIPPGVYFNTPEITITVWIFPQQFPYNARVIDFANGPWSDNIILSYSMGTSPQPYFNLFSGATSVLYASSMNVLNLREWQFLAVAFNGTSAKIYINGQLSVDQNQPFTLQTLSRNSCFVGKSNWADGYSNSYLDDLRFYNKSLTQVEILELMKYNGTGEMNSFKYRYLNEKGQY